MAVSTKLFTERQLDNFSKISTRIEQNQAKIASGKALASASEDPEKAIKISSLDEKIQQTANYVKNLKTANERLGAADVALGSISNILTRLQELTIQAANDTYSINDKAMIQAEALEIRKELLSLANTHDSRGKPLFSGTTGAGMPFSEKNDGSIVYQGNGQRSFVRSTVNTTVSDSLSGAEVFYAETPGGERVNYFQIIDNLISSLETPAHLKMSATISDSASQQIKLQSTDKINSFSFDLVGEFGAVKIDFTTTNNGISDAIASINKHTALTGITAAKHQTGEGIVLNNLSGAVEIQNFSDGSVFGDNENQIIIVDQNGSEDRVVNGSLQVNRNIALFSAALDNVALNRSRVGSLMNQVDNSLKVNENMKDLLEISFSDLAGADLEKLITELQSLLVNRDVARQTYTNITQTTLFDFIR